MEEIFVHIPISSGLQHRLLTFYTMFLGASLKHDPNGFNSVLPDLTPQNKQVNKFFFSECVSNILSMYHTC